MTNKNYKEIINYIQKFGIAPPTKVQQQLPMTPAADKEFAKPQTKPVGGGGYAAPAYGTKLPQVQEMQVAIQNFAKSVTQYSAAKPSPLVGGAGAASAVDGYKKNFNNFITENYIATSGVKGAEWTPDPKKVKEKDKQPTDLLEMDLVIDGLKRIGLEAKESAVDGIWWFRTNNALKNVYAFAVGLVNLQKDFEAYQENDFTSEDLNVLKSNIPDDPKMLKTNEDKIKRAEALTPLINKLTDFYKSYVKRISENPKYANYIEAGASFKEFPTSEKDEAEKTPDEQKMISNLGQYTLKNIKINNKVIPELNLLYLSSLKDIKFLATNVLGYTPNEADNPETIKKIIDQLNEHIKTVSGPTATTAPAPASKGTQRAFLYGTEPKTAPKRTTKLNPFAKE